MGLRENKEIGPPKYFGLDPLYTQEEVNALFLELLQTPNVIEVFLNAFTYFKKECKKICFLSLQDHYRYKGKSIRLVF